MTHLASGLRTVAKIETSVGITNKAQVARQAVASISAKTARDPFVVSLVRPEFSISTSSLDREIQVIVDQLGKTLFLLDCA